LAERKVTSPFTAACQVQVLSTYLKLEPIRKGIQMKKERLIKFVIEVAADRGVNMTEAEAKKAIKDLGGVKAADRDDWYDELKDYVIN
jgi:hypothetical protein